MAGNVPGVLSSTAIAAVATMAYGGQMIGPPFIGFGAEVVSLRFSLVLLAFMCVVMTVLAANLPAAVKKS